MRTVKIILLAAIIFNLYCGACLANDIGEKDYFAIVADGKKIGHAIMTREVKDGVVRTSENMNFTITRFGMQIKAAATETYIETTEGKPLGFESHMDASGMVSSTVGTIDENGKMSIVLSAGGMTQNKTQDYPEGALMAEGLSLMQAERGLKEGDKFSVKFFIPSMLTAADAEIETGSREKIDLFGRVVMATKQTVKMNMMGQNINTVDYIGEDMSVLKSITPAMGMNLELIACDKIIALSKDDVYDMMDKFIVKCPATLGDVSKLESVTYHLVPSEGKKLALPQGSMQSVSEKDGRYLVKVKNIKPKAGVKMPYKGKDKTALESLGSTQFVQSDNELVSQLAKEAIGKTEDAAEAASRIEKFVGEYITEKSLSVGYASAAEVALSKEGDCSEHAVLTAAMCRAVGIPARIAVGLVYVQDYEGHKDILGPHAWTECYINGKWIGLDATRGFGAGHIKLATGNGDPADFLGMINSLGQFTIDKVELKTR